MPRVSVRNSFRMPISPRAGTRYSSRIQPVPWLTMSSIRPLAERQELGHDAHVVLGDVDREPLDGLVKAAVDLARHRLRLAHRQLEALATHRLDQHRQLQLSPSLHLPRVGGSRSARTWIETLPTSSSRRRSSSWRPVSLLARPAGERRGVDADRHRERGLVHGEQRAAPRARRAPRSSRRSSPPESPRRRRSRRPRRPRPRRARAPRSRRAPRCARARRCRRAGTRRPPRRAGSSRGERGRRRAGRGRGRRRGSSPAPAGARRGRRWAPGSARPGWRRAARGPRPRDAGSSVAHPSRAEA